MMLNSSMKNFNLYKYGTLSILSVMLLNMTGCTIPFLDQTPKPVTLRYESLWESEQTYADVFNNYKNSNPNVSVSFQDRSSVDLQAYKKDLLDRLSTNRDVPDVIRIHSSWLPLFQRYLAPAPTELFSKEFVDQNYYPSLSSIIIYKTQDGSQSYVYGVPLYYDQLNLVYNTSHFSEASLTPPVTWEQFFRSASLLTKKDLDGKIARSGAAYGSQDLEFHSDTFGFLMGNAGLKFPNFEEDNLSALTSVLRVLNRNTDWNPEFVNSGNAFASRRASMVIAPAWRINDILASNPTIEIDITGMPSSRQDNPQNWPSFYLEVVPANSPNSLEAWKLLKHMSSEASAQDIYSKQSSIRVLPSLPALKTLADKIELNPILKKMSRDALTSRSAYGDNLNHLLSDRAGNDECISLVLGFSNPKNDREVGQFITARDSILQACGFAPEE